MICTAEKCTACGACVASCEKKAIVLTEDSFGTLYPFVDENKCVRCFLCRKVCPNNQEIAFKKVTDCYAAYSKNKYIYNAAASGGIASELYRVALECNFFVMGTCFERKSGVFFREIKNDSDLKWASNSKYVYSNMLSAFEKYLNNLQIGRNALFIGLPCQCAALYFYINLKDKKLNEKLYLVNLICHGVPNWKYLDEHLSSIEYKYKNETASLFFRGKVICESRKNFSSFDYHLRCISDDSRLFYIRDMHKNETYGNAFLSSLIFRENCYSCSYARSERFSDLTIGDYDGLGCMAEYKNQIKQVSCILVSSEKGSELVNKVSNSLYLERRPLQEPFKMNGQLNFPSCAHRNKDKFKKIYFATGDFELAVKKTLFKELYLSFDFYGKIKSFIKRNFHFIYAIYEKIKLRQRSCK